VDLARTCAQPGAGPDLALRPRLPPDRDLRSLRSRGGRRPAAQAEPAADGVGLRHRALAVRRHVAIPARRGVDQALPGGLRRTLRVGGGGAGQGGLRGPGGGGGGPLRPAGDHDPARGRRPGQGRRRSRGTVGDTGDRNQALPLLPLLPRRNGRSQGPARRPPR
jgi:hypothetical protein